MEFMGIASSSVREAEVMSFDIQDNLLSDIDSNHIKDLVDGFIHYCTYTEQMSPATMTTRTTHLKQFASFCQSCSRTDITELTVKWLDFYFYEYSQTHAPSTVNTDKRIIKAFFRWCNEREGIDCIKPEVIRSRKNTKPRPRYIEHDIIQRVINNEPNDHTNLLIHILYNTGLRIAEACRLEYADIDGLNIYVKGKGGKERTVYMTDSLKEHIDDYVVAYGRECGTLLRTNEKTARLWLQRSFKNIAQIHVTPHQLRHSYAIRLLTHNCDLVTIQKLLGHDSLSTTQIYLQIKDSLAESQYRKAMHNAQAY